MGGLFGYSSENSIRSLNVPAKKEREGVGVRDSVNNTGRERVCEGRKSFCEGNTNGKD